MSEMPKKKTSINIEDSVWQKWLIFVVTKYGSARKVSEATTEALEEYMRKREMTK
jgi:hypothetical protein